MEDIRRIMHIIDVTTEVCFGPELKWTMRTLLGLVVVSHMAAGWCQKGRERDSGELHYLNSFCDGKSLLQSASEHGNTSQGVGCSRGSFFKMGYEYGLLILEVASLRSVFVIGLG